MTQPHSQTTSPAPVPVVAAFAQGIIMPVLVLVPFPMVTASLPLATIPAVPGPTATDAGAHPAPAEKTAAPTTTAPPPACIPGAGLPAPLMNLLRGEEGPFLANEVFRITPTEPLAAIEEPDAAPEWYAVTRGRFVGVVDQFALSAVAITGVPNGARKAYTTQGQALTAFNQALTWGGVQVV